MQSLFLIAYSPFKEVLFVISRGHGKLRLKGIIAHFLDQCFLSGEQIRT